MTDDIIQALERIRRCTSALRELITAAQAQAPAQTQGTDSTGAVQVVLGPDGLPNRSRWQATGVDGYVRPPSPPRWSRQAARQHIRAWQPGHSIWPTSIGKAQWTGCATPTNPKPATTPAPDTPTDHAHIGQVRPRSLDVVAEDALRAFDTIDRYTHPPALAAHGIGQAAGGLLTLTLSITTVVSCTAIRSG